MENKNVEVLDENVKTEKKKSPVGIIILVVVLMIGCLVGGYFINEAGVFTSSKDKEEKEEKKEEEKEEEKEPVVTNYAATDEKVSKLIDNILYMGLSHDEPGFCNVLEVYANDKKVEAKSISNLMAYHIAEANEFNKKVESFTLDEMNKAIKKYLGKDYNFDPTAIDYKGSSCPQYNYDNSTKTFTKQQTTCGGTCGPIPSYKIVKAVDTDGVLELDTKVVFVSLNEGKNGYYSDYAKTNKVGTFEDNIDSLSDKGSDYKFTFKLEDGNYVFVSSEPIK